MVLAYLRERNRGDGICLATSKDIVRHLETEKGLPIHGTGVIRAYIRELCQEGRLEAIPYSPDLELPVLGNSTHGYKRQVLRLTSLSGT
jgi:hypothetical protein